MTTQRPSRHDLAARSAPQVVRIIGGRYKRTPLPVAVWPGLRPTSARVRETLFNWLGQDLSGWRVLDAFAGSGALGLEAASRGAAEVVMLEREPALARHISQVVERLGAQAASVQVADAVAWMRGAATATLGGRFDLVLLDPPFDVMALFGPALEAAVACVPPGGWIYLEAPCRYDTAGAAAVVNDACAVQPLPAGLAVRRHGRAGVVHYHLIERVDSADACRAPLP